MEWAKRVPTEEIPRLLVFLAGRLLTEAHADRGSERSGASAREAEKLLTAYKLAECLGVPESWVRTEERARSIPSIRLGKYVRFKLTDVERALGQRQRQGA